MSNNAIAAVLSLLLAGAGAAIFAAHACSAVKSGIFPYIDHSVRAKSKPLAFWTAVAIWAVGAIALIAIGAYALWRLASGV